MKDQLDNVFERILNDLLTPQQKKMLKAIKERKKDDTTH